MKAILNLKLVIFVCLCVGADRLVAAPSGLLNDTGQTQCLNVAGTALEACTWQNSGEVAFTGQDGRFGRDAAERNLTKSGFTKIAGSGGHGGFAFTPLDVNGNPIPLVGDPPVPAETPRCVWDEVTNLIWEVKTDDGGLQDKDWTYEYGWGSMYSRNCIGLKLCGSNDYIIALNATSVCQIVGAGVWRLPSVHELLSIVDHGLKAPAIDTRFFQNTPGKFPYFWGNDVWPDSQTEIPYAWFVNFIEGTTEVGPYNTTYNAKYSIRLVRDGPGGTPSQFRFKDHYDGTITDTITGLMWDKCSWRASVGQYCLSSTSAARSIWLDALSAPMIANAGSMAGYKSYYDWRVPNRTELGSLVKFGVFNPAIDTTAFPDTPTSCFWSSTVDANSPINAWSVNFYDGDSGTRTRDSSCYVRLVRGGQVFGDFDSLAATKPGPLSATVTAVHKSYDGSTTASISGCILTGNIFPGDVVTCSAASANFSDANVGWHKVITVTGITLEGADADKYTLSSTSATTTANITAKSLTTASVTVADKSYDGSATATLSGCTLTGVISPDVVTCSAASASFADANVGTAKDVTATGITLAGDDAGNYTLSNTNATTTASITRKTLTAEVWAADKYYDGTSKAWIKQCALPGVVSPDVVTCSATDASFAEAYIGKGILVTATGITLAGGDAAKYKLSSSIATDTANINPKPLMAVVTVSDKLYDGTTYARLSGCSLPDVVSPDLVTCSATSASFADDDIGTAKPVTATGIKLAGVNVNKYTLISTTATTTANITARPLTVQVTVANKLYDGTTNATVSKCTLIGLTWANWVTCSASRASFADANVGTNKTVTATGITLAGDDAYKYTLSSSASTTTANITKATATVSFSNLTQTFTGSPLTPTATTTPSGLAVTWTGAPQTSIGSYPVTATIINSNYQGSASGTFVIKSTSQTTVSASPSAPLYGQTVTLSATVTGINPTGQVTFKDGATVLGTATLSGGKASLTTSTLAVGAHSLTVSYGGDANNQASSSPSSSLTVSAKLDVIRNGLGAITSSPAGITCGTDCTETFGTAATVQLTATPDPTYVFDKWTGACTGTNPVCTVTMDAAKTVSAEFVINYPLIRSRRNIP